jgi:HEAT repeat protein
MYDYMRSGKINLEAIMEAAETATLGRVENLDKLKEYLENEESAIRYWGATGLLILGENATPAIDELKAALNDESANVVSVAAEAVYNLGEMEIAKEALLSVLKNPNEFARCHALNVIDCIEEESPEIQKGVVDMIAAAESNTRNNYDMRAAKWLIEKWGINPDDHGIMFAW